MADQIELSVSDRHSPIELNDELRPAQDSLIEQSIRSVKWSFLGNLVPRLITPVSSIIIAGFLTPRDFGIVAMATMITNLAMILMQLGLQNVVVQQKNRVEEVANLVFWINLLITFTIYGVLFVSSSTIAQLFDTQELKAVVRVASLNIIFRGLSIVPSGLLTRQLSFRRLFWVNSSPRIIASIISVILVTAGARYWALITGPLVGQAISLIWVWLATKWMPSISFQINLLRTVLVFSLWELATGMLTWLSLQGDNALAGYLLGADKLGVYALGYNFSMLIPGMLITTVAAVAFPTFCAIQDDREQIGRMLLQLQMFSAAILAPIALGASAVSRPGLGLMYGNRWPELYWVVQFLIIMPGLRNIWSINGHAYRAIGKPGVWTSIMTLQQILIVPALIFASQGGLKSYSVARFIVPALLVVVEMYIAKKYLKISLADQFHSVRVPLLSSLLMYLILSILVYSLEPFVGLTGWVKLLFAICVGAAIYVIALVRLDRTIPAELFRVARRML